MSARFHTLYLLSEAWLVSAPHSSHFPNPLVSTHTLVEASPLQGCDDSLFPRAHALVLV